MAKLIFQNPKGMPDILPEDWAFYHKIFDVVREIATFYGFRRIETPILEETQLFNLGVGISTDIVQKEMFSFRTKGGDKLSLRPEGTAPVVRAYFQHGLKELPQPVKLWYFSPFFRYERPQAGRQREFWQFGLEILGEESWVLDAQIIQIFLSILKELGISELKLRINSIGDKCCRGNYRKELVSFLKSKSAGLCQNCKRRLKENPLRILDCKEEKCKEIVSQAPQILDYLCENCSHHFKKVLEVLDRNNIQFYLDPFLVRGLDYYTRTVFEIESEKAKVGSLVGGGRYDALGKLIGNENLPAVGGAGGVERVVEAMKAENLEGEKTKKPKIILIQIGELAKMESLKILEEFRKNRIQVLEFLGKDSLKSQLKLADKLKVKFALILGQKEALEEMIILKNLETGKQRLVKIKNLISEMKRLK